MNKLKFRRKLIEAVIVYTLGDYPYSNYSNLMDELCQECSDSQWKAVELYCKLADSLIEEKDEREGEIARLENRLAEVRRN